MEEEEAPPSERSYEPSGLPRQESRHFPQEKIGKMETSLLRQNSGRESGAEAEGGLQVLPATSRGYPPYDVAQRVDNLKKNERMREHHLLL